MKRKTVALMTALTLAVSLSACGSTPTSGNDSDKLEELDQRIEELEAENKELRAQTEDSASAEESQQAGNEVENLLTTTVNSPEISGVCGENLTWYYQNGVLAITGKGEMTDYNAKGSPWYDIRDKIGWIIIDDEVTSIGDYAFYDLQALSNVALSDTILNIGQCAFEKCGNLSQIAFPNSIISIGIGAFSKCSLKEIIFPVSLKEIGFREYNFPDFPVSIGTGAFEGCNLEKVTFCGDAPQGLSGVVWYNGTGPLGTGTTEEQLKEVGQSLCPMVIYYNGDTFDEFINSYPYWDEFDIKWIKQ